MPRASSIWYSSRKRLEYRRARASRLPVWAASATVKRMPRPNYIDVSRGHLHILDKARLWFLRKSFAHRFVRVDSLVQPALPERRSNEGPGVQRSLKGLEPRGVGEPGRLYTGFVLPPIFISPRLRRTLTVPGRGAQAVLSYHGLIVTLLPGAIAKEPSAEPPHLSQYNW